jgi:methyl-accepting chemotaxis protein
MYKVARSEGVIGAIHGGGGEVVCPGGAPEKVIAYFTDTNATLLNMVGALASANTNAELSQMAGAYFTFHLAKEKVGVERAQLANVFGTGAFAPGQFFTVSAAISAQESFLRIFAESAKPAILSRYETTMADPVVAEVKAMEQIAVTKGAAGNFGVDSAVWYEKITAKINLLKQVEDAQAAAILARAQQLRGSAGTARNLAVGLTVVALLAALGLSALIIRGITGPLRLTAAVLERVADGDLTAQTEVSSRDEIGRLGAALNRAVAGMREALRQISTGADRVAGSAGTLSATSAQMRDSTAEVSQQASGVSAAATQVSGNVQTVAAGAEQIGASIKEIATSSSEAARITSQAVAAAQAATRTVSQLGDSSTEIGNVLKLITSIAEQTNLLALNATIEAARAGEAGKGFAVVASEVKDLAQETAKATEDISTRIEAIQNDTTAAVEAIKRITTVIDSINGHVTTIASAVEEQSATTNEINRSITEAATGSSTIAGNIANLAETTDQTSAAAINTRQAAQDLTGLSTELKQLLARFHLS